MKKIKLISTIFFIFFLAFSMNAQEKDEKFNIYQENPAYISFTPNQIFGSIGSKWWGFNGAPREKILTGNFNFNKNVVLGAELKQHSVKDYDKTSFQLKYGFRIENFSFGLEVTPTWSAFSVEAVQLSYLVQSDYQIENKSIPGVDVGGGIFYNGDNLIFSLSGRQSVLNVNDLNNYEESKLTTINADFGYKFLLNDNFGLLLSVGTEVPDFNLFKDPSTLPLHLDAIVSIKKTIQFGIRADYPEGFVLSFGIDHKNFLCYIAQDLDMDMFGSVGSTDYFSTLIGVGIRLGNKSGSKQWRDKKEGGENE